MTHWLSDEWSAVKSNRTMILSFYLSSVVIGIIAFLLCRHLVSFSQHAFTSISQSLGVGQNPKQPLWFQCISLFSRNSLIAFSIIGIGLVPVIVIPFLLLSYQMVIVSIILSFGSQIGEDPIHAMIFGVVPHGIFEMTAVVFASVLGTRLSLKKYKKLREKEYARVISIDKEDKKLFKSYLLIIVPLLFVAACIETYITPLLLN